MKKLIRQVASPPTTALIILTATSLFMLPTFVLAEPRTQNVSLICGPNHQKNVTLFGLNFIATMASIDSQVNNADRLAVGSAGSGLDASYALYQCYGDLSQVDCQICQARARTILPTCTPSNDGRIFLNGCFMRCANYRFFEEWTGPGDKAACGGKGSRKVTVPGFDKATRRAVSSAVAGAAGRNGYARGKARGSWVNGSAYVLANCWGTLNASSCRACLEDASGLALGCLPWSEGRALKTGCFLRYSNVDFLNPEQPNGGTLIVAAVIVASCMVVLIVGGTIGFYIWTERKLQKRRGLNDVEKLSRILNHSGLNFKFSTLEMATGCFHEANKLGQGGYAAVYKGVLSDGREIAVKRLFYNNAQRIADFYNEVNIISSMEHKNLVRLLGCSCSKSESLLVYEFLPNLSLDRFIFDSDKGKLLDWEKRLDIIIGTAEGLLYLHENADVKIIHRDIKASNILLNSKLGAKIADFGLARSLEEDNSHISTKIAGTLGYMAPEYVVHGRLTEKADIYSFGILLLEIISGQRSVNEHMSEYDGSLVICAWKLYIEGRVEELIDPNILPPHQQEGCSSSSCEAIKNEVMKSVRIGLLCTQETPALRPAMPNVVRMLTVKDEELPSPTNPPFIDHNKMEINNPIFGHVSGEGEPLSIATVSHNSFCPR